MEKLNPAKAGYFLHGHASRNESIAINNKGSCSLFGLSFRYFTTTRTPWPTIALSGAQNFLFSGSSPPMFNVDETNPRQYAVSYETLLEIAPLQPSNIKFPVSYAFAGAVVAA